MTKPRILAVCIIGTLALSGCESVEWYKPGADAETAEADRRECRQQSRLYVQNQRLRDPGFLRYGPRSPFRCSWPADRDRSLGLAGCPGVGGSYGYSLSPGAAMARQARLEEELTDRCLSDRGYKLTPVDDIESRADDSR